MTKDDTRDSFVDILKAIGIISIVIGHSSGIIFGKFNIGRYVYLYHIMIFFFVAGLCFKKENSQKPFQYIGKRLEGIYVPFIKYGVVFVLLHNLFLKYHLISGERYSIDIIISKISSVLLLKSTETLLGACWFLAVLFFASALFCAMFHIAEKQTNSLCFHVLFCVTSGVFGIYVNQHNIQMDYHIHTAFLAIPIIYLGYFAKKYILEIRKYLNVVSTVLLSLILYSFVMADKGLIELAAEQIYSAPLFYPITILGILFCSGTAQLISKNEVCSKVFAYIGKNSFHIMALHFLCFKIVDFIYGNLTGSGADLIERFPHSYPFWYVYYIVGVFLPIVIHKLTESGVRLIKGKRLNFSR